MPCTQQDAEARQRFSALHLACENRVVDRRKRKMLYGLMMRSCTAREAAAEIVAQPSLKRAVFR